MPTLLHKIFDLGYRKPVAYTICWRAASANSSFFPGFERRMRKGGAEPVETSWDIATLGPNGWSQRNHTGLWQLYASRPLIESTVLELCRGLRNVTFLERTDVIPSYLGEALCFGAALQLVSVKGSRLLP
jgi:hypothetical protein